MTKLPRTTAAKVERALLLDESGVADELLEFLR
jgi:hypothetical protein